MSGLERVLCVRWKEQTDCYSRSGEWITENYVESMPPSSEFFVGIRGMMLDEIIASPLDLPPKDRGDFLSSPPSITLQSFPTASALSDYGRWLFLHSSSSNQYLPLRLTGSSDRTSLPRIPPIPVLSEFTGAPSKLRSLLLTPPVSLEHINTF